VKILPLRSRFIVVACQYLGESVLLQYSLLDCLAFFWHRNFFRFLFVVTFILM
jgi:hypothetical protein